VGFPCLYSKTSFACFAILDRHKAEGWSGEARRGKAAQKAGFFSLMPPILEFNLL
jgi:hypothetical protein